MDKTLKTICGLLKSSDNMRQCAAALVLAELAPKNAQVVKALGGALDGAGSLLTGCILEALNAIGSKAAVPFVMPLLDADEPTVRLQAAAIVSRAGAAVVPEVKRKLASAGRRQKLVLVDVLARVQTRDAFALLLDLLFDHDMEVVKQICDGMGRYTREASAAVRLSLHKQVVRLMNSAKVKERDRVLISCLLLLGNIGRPEARTVLLKYTSPKLPPPVRRHALVGLKRLTYTTPTARATLAKVFPFIEEPDADIVRQVLDIIDRLPDTVITASHTQKFLKSRHGYVRAFAAQRLAGTDTAANNRQLVELLRHEDRDVQEIAARTLAGHKKATPVLLAALAKEKNVDAAWRFVRILKPHSGNIDKKTLRMFAARAAKELAAKKPLHEPLMYFVANADAKTADKILLDLGLKHKKAGRWAEGVDCLRRLIRTELFDDTVGYALNVCDLKKSDKDLSPQFRAQCYALRGFRFLLRSPKFKFLEQLKKDKTLTAEDLYYVGFHFREQLGDEHVFGEELLKHVGKKWPRSKEGKAVKAMFKPVRARPKNTAAPKTKAASRKKPARKVAKKKPVAKKPRKKARN